jgi:hypothetical protein
MIAPLRQTYRPAPETTGARYRMREARRTLASILLPQSAHSLPRAPTVTRWRAWLFTSWVALVGAAYFAHVLGLW